MNLTLGYQPISLIKWQKHCRETAKIIKNVLIQNSKCKRGLLDVFEIQMEDVELSTLETITGKLDYENPQPKEVVNEVNEDKSTMEKIKNVPKGAILFIGDLRNDTSREDIKHALIKLLKTHYCHLCSSFMTSSDNDIISFIDFEKGKTSGYVRFKRENGANHCIEHFKKCEKIEINGVMVETLKVLEGDEEEEYLIKAENEKSARKANFKSRRGRKRNRTNSNSTHKRPLKKRIYLIPQSSFHRDHGIFNRSGYFPT